MKLRPEVQAFAEQMEIQLRENDYKGGWDGCSDCYLLGRIEQERKELDKAIVALQNRDGLIDALERNVIHESADVANFAMMIACNKGRLMEHANEDHD